MLIHDILTHLHAFKASSSGLYDLFAVFGLATAFYLYVRVCLWAGKPLVQYIGLDSSGKLVLRNDKRKVWDAQQELKDLRDQLDRERNAREQAEALALEGDAVARLRGRVARVDTIDEDDVNCIVWLVLSDEYEDDFGELRPGGHQAIRIKCPRSRIWKLSDGCMVTAVCRFHRGRLELDYFDEIEDSSEPMPAKSLPERYTKVLMGETKRLPSFKDLDVDGKKKGWGSLNHCVFRHSVPVHITMASKRREAVFESCAADAQQIMREVAESEGVTVLAIAAEVDHIHLLIVVAGEGGTPPTWVWSSWIGRWKALTSKKLKEIPGLEGFTWQTGYAITSVSGGKQSAESALEVVRAYIANQGDQEEPLEVREEVMDEA
jgi:REP element-mobilizing transposase RayT